MDAAASVPTGEDALFQFLAEPDASEDLHLRGPSRPTPTARSSTGPAPRAPTRPRRRSRRSRSLGGGGSSTLAIVALVVGAIGVVARRASRSSRGGRRAARVTRRRVALDRSSRSRRCSRCRPRRGRTPRSLRTVPVGERHRSNAPPTQVALTFSEAVEPRFAIVSVTDAGGHQETTGAAAPLADEPRHARRAAEHVPEGWYLVYWRVISVDGHPVRGAFTFAVGPNPGPAPQFPIPSISETAATPALVIARWVVFLSVMAAIGLFALRIAIARPLVRRVDGTSLRRVTVAFVVAAAVGARRDPGLPRCRDRRVRAALGVRRRRARPADARSAFGRGFLDLELCFALFVAAAGVALWVDRPEREQRSIAELLASAARSPQPPRCSSSRARPATPRRRRRAAARCVARLDPPRRRLGLARRARRPARALARAAVRPGGVAGLGVAVPRFSNVAFVSVLLLIGSGNLGRVRSTCRRSARSGRPRTERPLLVKVGLLLGGDAARVGQPAAHQAAAGSRAGSADWASRPRACCAGSSAARCCSSPRRSSRRRCSRASRRRRRRSRRWARRSAHVGPGPVGGCGVEERLPARAPRRPEPGGGPEHVLGRGSPGTASRCRGADVTVAFAMLDMEMGQQAYHLAETAPGVYAHSAPGAGHGRPLGLSFDVTPQGEAAVQRPARRQGERMNRLLLDVRFKLFAALVALALGAAAILVVVLFAQSVLG